MTKISKNLMLGMVLVSLVACGGKKEAAKTEGTEAAAAGAKIGVTVYKYDDNFMATVRTNMEEMAKTLGLELNMADSQNSQSTQNDQVDVFLSKNMDAYAINLVDPAAAQTILDKIKAAGKPIVFYNKEPDAATMASYDKVYYVGTDSKESGVIQGQLIADEWAANKAWDLNGDGKIQFVLLKGEPGHPDAEARTEWVVKTLNEKGIGTEELNKDTAMWDTAQAKDKMDAWISGPNKDKIEVVICNNDAMAFGAIESLKAAGKTTVPTFGIDALPEALAKVKSGELAGTVLNDAKNQAKATLELAKNLAAGKDPLDGTSWKLDDKKAVRVPYVAVNKTNVADFE
ncbi:MAG: galactose/glucose ABC transporter substrate-binding protein MglB [Fusobacteriaceae bacterium]|jgi:methyl-galactoside transport system substrate-binding protein|nr:galactose/glucose ABC transporter substrate-binding protein MglB [Fusobacteriaceae bacterium]MBP6467689.1 galactose/glucose ABC transporter substrate-binding protein MglB [Fusobacteriaceae bacterium]MBP9596049.1 galactose/glucose ABC transporter substrate-binding protein MglB [Fusobacteriaceae bacterium]MBU9918219.1 galactose/glucose ABC transporter substrate-binding protein MglB [Fusobacteriaceae bacterium]